MSGEQAYQDLFKRDPLSLGVGQALQPQQPAVQAPPAQDGENWASPEEQNQYDQLATHVRKFIHGKQSRDKIVDQLKPLKGEAGDDAVARVSAAVMQGAMNTMQQAGAKPLPDAVFEAGKDLVEDLSEIAIAARVVKNDPKLPDKAFPKAIAIFGNRLVATGNPHQEEAQNFMAAKIAEEVDSGQVQPGSLSNAGALPPLRPGAMGEDVM